MKLKGLIYTDGKVDKELTKKAYRNVEDQQ